MQRQQEVYVIELVLASRGDKTVLDHLDRFNKHPNYRDIPGYKCLVVIGPDGEEVLGLVEKLQQVKQKKDTYNILCRNYRTSPVASVRVVHHLSRAPRHHRAVVRSSRLRRAVINRGETDVHHGILLESCFISELS